MLTDGFLFDPNPSGLTSQAEADYRSRHGQGHASSRSSDPATSKQAAHKMNMSGTVGTHEARIVELLRSGPQTSHEIAERSAHEKGLTLSKERVHKRMKGLETKRLVSRAIVRKCQCKREAVPDCQGNEMIAWALTGIGA